MKRSIIVTLSMLLLTSLFAQQAKNEDIFNVNYEKKSARKAMFMSSLIPGSGQLYVSRKSITGYIFPVLEIGLWYGYYHFNKQGKDIEDDYKYYANKEVIDAYWYQDEDGTAQYKQVYRYNRQRQIDIQSDLQQNANNPFYDDHFRLDNTDTQHFYEDIGKYNKYIFGWYDWYNIYAMNANGEDILPSDAEGGSDWLWDNNIWIGNSTQNPSSPYYTQNSVSYDLKSGKYSGMRDEYIKMRDDAENEFSKSSKFIYGILFNHILAAADAIRVTKKYNFEMLTRNKINIKLAPVFVQNHLSAGIMVSKRF